MKRCLSLVASTLFLAAACTPPTLQVPSDDVPARAEWRFVNLVDKDGTPVATTDDAATAAYRYVQDRRSLLGLSERDDLILRSSRIGAGGIHHVRMQQYLEGVPVFGADVVVHLSDTTFKSIVGNLVAGLGNTDLTAQLDSEDAIAVAKAAYAQMSKDGATNLAYSRESTMLSIYPTGPLGAKLAWRVIFFTELQDGIDPGLWNYFVDAQTGEILFSFNAIDTLSQASGPGGNAKVSRTWNNELDVEPSGSQYKMDTADLYTTNMNHSTSGSGTVVTGPLDNIGDAAINDAHGFAELTLKQLQNWMGYDSIDGNGFIIRSRVHYGNNYENAFWDGSQMTYGDGASTFYPLSGDIDVVAHEINHGFTSNHSDLTYSGQSGGINEAFSDIAGTITEFYHEGAGADWDLGRDIFKSSSGALRYMCDPTADGASIDNAADYYSGLDVHYSSGVFNKAFCRSAKRFASGSPTGTATPDSVHTAGKAFYEANANYWTASTNFTQGCQGVVDAATALGYSSTEIGYLRDSFADVGVFCDGATEPPPTCDETFTSASGSFTSPNYPNNYPNNYNHTWCVDTGSMATLHFDAFNTESGYDFVTVRDANAAVLSTTAGSTAPADATSMKLYVTFKSDGSVTASGFSASWSSGGGGNTAPTVSLTAPADGSTVSGMVTVSATASDSDGSVDHVTFHLPDGSTVNDSSAPYSTTWDSSTVADGSGYDVSAEAVDDMGASSGLDTHTVSVSNGTDCIDGIFDATDVPISIPDNNSTGIASMINVSGAGNVGTLHVSVNITHTWIGDLRVRLIGPDGTEHILHNRTGGSADNIVISDLQVTTFDGKSAAGTWTLRVSDHARYDVGTLNSWSLDIVGDCGSEPPPPPGNWSGSATPNLPTVDNGTVCTTLTVMDDGNAADAHLDIAGVHDWRSILRATLEHNGQTVEAFPTGTFPYGAGTFAFTDRVISGLTGSAAGDWTLCLTDTDGYNDTGTLQSWSVHN